jgi:hypothetical protein
VVVVKFHVECDRATRPTFSHNNTTSFFSDSSNLANEHVVRARREQSAYFISGGQLI